MPFHAPAHRVTSVRCGVYPIVSTCGKEQNGIADSCRIIRRTIFRVDVFMKKICLMLVMCLFAAAAVAQQSLGDVARANRSKKPASSSEVKLDDDNMPRSSTPSAAEPDADKKKADDKKAGAANRSALLQAPPPVPPLAHRVVDSTAGTGHRLAGMGSIYSQRSRV